VSAKLGSIDIQPLRGIVVDVTVRVGLFVRAHYDVSLHAVELVVGTAFEAGDNSHTAQKVFIGGIGWHLHLIGDECAILERNLLAEEKFKSSFCLVESNKHGL